MTKTNFKVSSALKDLLGKELVTDKFVAVFELVKNAADAGADNVDITFDCDTAGKCVKISIKDDGCGMNADDVRNKWLFVGYSEKRHSADSDDKHKLYAGAKGVGRFSCDRLGAKLQIITRRKGEKFNLLAVDWGDFEKDSLTEFSKISIMYDEVKEPPLETFRHGTTLEITELRDEWARQDLLTLKRHLTKLVNPVATSGDSMQICLHCERELRNDQLKEAYYQKVNGKIENFLFEALPFKTISLSASISSDGKVIETELTDKGKLVYRVRENNKDYPSLKNIEIKIFQLNKAAKESFRRVMSIAPVRFGSVFVYKNGFRIYPFGELGDDSLGLDHRKQQGYSRYLGTREVMGRIVLNGRQENLNETTSRSGGLIRNETYESLLKFFREICIIRLEKYAVDVVKWGELKEDTKNWEKLNAAEKTASLITKLVESNNLISMQYNPDFLSIVNKAQEISVLRLPEQLIEIASGLQTESEARQLRRAAENIKQIATASKHAEDIAERYKQEKEKLESKLQQRDNQVLFLSHINNANAEYMLQCFHAIVTYSLAISNWVDVFNERNEEGQLDDVAFSEIASAIAEINKKTLTLSRMVTKANFNATAKKIKGDIFQFIREYFTKILSELFAQDMKFNILKSSDEFKVEYSPLKLGMALENIAFNSFKSKSKNLSVKFLIEAKKVAIQIYDDGHGLKIPDKDASVVFQKGYTTTSGSGLGLYQVKNCFAEMGADVSVDSTYTRGFKLLINFNL